MFSVHPIPQFIRTNATNSLKANNYRENFVADRKFYPQQIIFIRTDATNSKTCTLRLVQNKV
jgi:hypothetical protein